MAFKRGREIGGKKLEEERKGLHNTLFSWSFAPREQGLKALNHILFLPPIFSRSPSFLTQPNSNIHSPMKVKCQFLVSFSPNFSGTSIAWLHCYTCIYIYMIDTHNSLIYIQIPMCHNYEIAPRSSAMFPHEVLDRAGHWWMLITSWSSSQLKAFHHLPRAAWQQYRFLHHIAPPGWEQWSRPI